MLTFKCACGVAGTTDPENVHMVEVLGGIHVAAVHGDTLNGISLSPLGLVKCGIGGNVDPGMIGAAGGVGNDCGDVGEPIRASRALGCHVDDPPCDPPGAPSGAPTRIEDATRDGAGHQQQQLPGGIPEHDEHT